MSKPSKNSLFELQKSFLVALYEVFNWNDTYYMEIYSRQCYVLLIIMTVVQIRPQIARLRNSCSCV